MKKLLVVLMLLVVLCLASNSFALDLNPPDWRGQLATTLTIWEFLTPDINPVPDIQINPFGFADTTVYPAHPWEEIWGGMDGVWPLSGALEVKIPNNPVENELKLIQIQLTWSSEYPVPTQPVVMIDATRVNGQAVPQDDINLIGQQSIQLDPTQEPGASEFWYHTTYLFEIVYPLNKIVVRYDYEGLVLLGILDSYGLEYDVKYYTIDVKGVYDFYKGK